LKARPLCPSAPKRIDSGLAPLRLRLRHYARSALLTVFSTPSLIPFNSPEIYIHKGEMLKTFFMIQELYATDCIDNKDRTDKTDSMDQMD